jgi:hypothetical protein
MGEADHVVVPVAQAFQQVTAGALLASGDAGDLGQAEQDPVPEGVDERPPMSSGTAARPWLRAVFAAWISPCSAWVTWTGQCAPGSASTAQHAVVVGAGTHTTVLPAAIAGARISAPIV